MIKKREAKPHFIRIYGSTSHPCVDKHFDYLSLADNEEDAFDELVEILSQE